MITERLKGINPEISLRAMGSFVLGKLLYTLLPLCLTELISEDKLKGLYSQILKKGLGVSRTADTKDLMEELGNHTFSRVIKNFRKLIQPESNTDIPN